MASYSQAVRKADILVLASQGGVDATTDKLVGPGIEEQTRQTLGNVQHLLYATSRPRRSAGRVGPITWASMATRP